MIRKLSYSRRIYKMDDDNWRAGLTADGGSVNGEACAIVYPEYECTVGGPETASTVIDFPAGASQLVFGVSCAKNATSNCLAGATLHHVAAVLYGATVTLSDPSSPTISNVAGSLFDPGYLTGPRSASFDASDNSGIRGSRLYVDGVSLPGATYSCDFTYAVPCSAQRGTRLDLDTRGLADGSHTVQVAATDAASNEARTATRSFVVDNGAPAAPQDLSVVGGDQVRTVNDFSVTWTDPPGQTAPIASASYRVCMSDGTTCDSTRTVTTAGGPRIDDVSVPAKGDWLLEVWLRDAAGNADPLHPATIALRYGDPPTTGGTTTTTTTTATTTTSTAPLVSPTSAPAIAADDPAAAPALVPSAPLLRSPGLHLTSARYSHGRLLIRGRTSTSAAGTVTIRFRAGKRVVRRSVRVTGGRFRTRIRLARGPRSRIVAIFLGNAFFARQAAARRATAY